eukprot:2404994-Amphidinium_carterae.1
MEVFTALLPTAIAAAIYAARQFSMYSLSISCCSYSRLEDSVLSNSKTAMGLFLELAVKKSNSQQFQD